MDDKEQRNNAGAFLSLLFVVGLILGAMYVFRLGPFGSKEEFIEATAIKLNHTSMNANVGDTLFLSAVVTPSNSTEAIRWSSSDKDVVVVSVGKIKALKAGVAIITARVNNVVRAECVVTVVGEGQAELESDFFDNVDEAENQINEDYSEVDKPVPRPTDDDYKKDSSSTKKKKKSKDKSSESTYKPSSKEDSNKGIEDPKKDDSGPQGIDANEDFTDAPIRVSSITLNKGDITLSVGSTSTLQATVTPSNATNKKVTWTSSNTSVATVSNGTVRTVAPGTATITATADGKSVSIVVTVRPIEVASVVLRGSNGIIYTNYVDSSLKKVKVIAEVNPTNATNKSLTWSSSDSSIATVDSSGNVTIGSAPGKVEITARANNGVNAKYSIEVRTRVVVIITDKKQATNMREGFEDYTSNEAKKMKYSRSNGTAYIVSRTDTANCHPTHAGGGAGGGYGTGYEYTCIRNGLTLSNSGISDAIDWVNSRYGSNKRQYVEPYFVFTTPDEIARVRTCSEINSGSFSQPSNVYSSAYSRAQNVGYAKVRMFMVSHFPVNVSQAKSYYMSRGMYPEEATVVDYSSSMHCKMGYISPWKLYRTNKMFKSSLTTSIKYVDTFAKYMEVQSEGSHVVKFSSNRPGEFNVTNDVTMSTATARVYTRTMLNDILNG